MSYNEWGFADRATLELSACCSMMNAAPRYSSGENKLVVCSRTTLFETFMFLWVGTAGCLSSRWHVLIRSCWCVENQNCLEKLSCLSPTFLVNDRMKESTKELWRWWQPFGGLTVNMHRTSQSFLSCQISGHFILCNTVYCYWLMDVSMDGNKGDLPPRSQA